MSKRSGRRKARAAADHAAAELRREAHARLVNERAGDPRYTQRAKTANGETYTFGTADSRVMMKALDGMADQFRAKFGRDPGPNDPVFFDPDADEPTFMTPEALEQEQRAVYGRYAAKAEARGMTEAAAHFRAAEEVGYMVIKESEHLLSATEIDAYWNAYDRYATA